MGGSKAKSLIIIVLAVLFAFYVGAGFVSDQKQAIGELLLLGGAFAIIALGRNIWLLFFTLAIPGIVRVGPGFELWALFVPLAFIVQLARSFFDKPKYTWNFTVLDLGVFLVFLAVAQNFVRNPVSVAFLGGNDVGGKPFYMVILSVFIYMACSMQRLSMEQVFKALKWCFFIGVGLVFVNLAGNFGKSPLSFLNDFYSLSNEVDLKDVDLTVRGLNIFLPASTLTLKFLFSYYMPITVLYPWNFVRFSGFLFGVAGTLLQGQRNQIMAMGLFFVTSMMLRKDFSRLALGTFLGAILLGLVIILEVPLTALPFGMQRSLSFLPVQVSEGAKGSADGSSEWRYEMWEEVLNTDKYIKNKMWGDGFKFDLEKMRLLKSTAERTRDTRILFLYSASYHSGPLTAIRYVGYTGFLATVLMFMAGAVLAWKICRRAFGYRQGWLILFYVIATIYQPFSWIFIFGDFKYISTIVASMGLLKLIWNAMREDEKREKVEALVKEEDEELPILLTTEV